MSTEQEYDAPDMIDDSEIDTPSGGVPYPATYGGDPSQSMVLSPTAAGPGQHSPTSVPTQAGPVSQAGYPSMTQLLDSSGMDWDPFGLTASMTFPTPFAFDPNTNMR